MAVNEYNLTENQKAERKLLVTCVNVGTAAEAEWEIEGAGVEESAVEFNPDTETITDIRGVTETTVNKLEMAQTFDPNTVRGGAKLSAKLDDMIQRNALSELSQFEVLLIRGYLGQSGAYTAELHKNCTITPQSLGGGSYVDMPFDINFSNDKELGTVDKLKGTITFTPAVSV